MEMLWIRTSVSFESSRLNRRVSHFHQIGSSSERVSLLTATGSSPKECLQSQQIGPSKRVSPLATHWIIIRKGVSSSSTLERHLHFFSISSTERVFSISSMEDQNFFFL